METLDQDLFNEALNWKCETHKIGEWATEECVNKDIEWIQETMTEVADLAIKRAKRKPNFKQAYWWNEIIAEARAKCIQDRRIWTKAKCRMKTRNITYPESGRLEENLKHLEKVFRKSRKVLVNEIYKAKEKCWKELISEIDDQWGRPYKIVMNRLKSAGPGLTETLEQDKLEKLITKLFPRETDQMEEGVRVDAWKDEWDISVEELCNVIRRKKRNTAPGPDCITARMWRKVPGKMVEKVTEIMNRLLRQGVFPAKWKVAKLVLIPKGKQDEAEIPKARPICLIDDIGKYLEKIIVERVDALMDRMYESGMTFRAISKNQFGFRKNRSTIDALYKVKDAVVEAKKYGETVVMISLDIENAFNSIPWKEIGKMLKKRMVPKYLIRMLNSYFKDRHRVRD